MKGLSAVIATLLMLLITVALASSAYMYISGMFSSARQCILIADKYCISGTAFFTIRNTCQDTIPARNITVTKVAPSNDPAEYSPCCIDGIPSRATKVYNDSCVSGSQCLYRFLAPTGQAVEDSVYCS